MVDQFLNIYLPSSSNETESSEGTESYIIRTALTRFADYMESHQTNLDTAFAKKFNDTKIKLNQTRATTVTQVKTHGKRLA